MSDWAMLERPPAEWKLEAMFDLNRHGPVSATPHVMLATPAYVSAPGELAPDEGLRGAGPYGVAINGQTGDANRSRVARSPRCWFRISIQAGFSAAMEE